ncbi:MerR family transcriptional regulator [Uliginosibacterium gangwonense]|uniref:MerR family transcriptional regulator n=1 Tax=Uliginosibacterium gangwonense TaxID=392736 RepID=UPI00036F9697|nr:effector binding domain-containing protein [Uliginosibacterium gangwonense]
MIPIGQLARLLGITTRTLRHYDAIGLFAPAWVAPDTGYRFYSAEQIAQLEHILHLRRLAVPLEQIQSLREQGALDHPQDFAAFLRQHQNTLRAEIAERSRLLDELEHFILHIEKGSVMNLPYTIVDLPAFDLIGMSVICEDPSPIPALWDRLNPRCSEIIGQTPGGAWYGVCERIDSERFRYYAGCATVAGAPIPTGMERTTIPAQRYVCVTHVGPVQEISETFRQAWQLLETTWKLTPTHGPDLERYGERYTGPQDAKSETDLFIPVREESAQA